MSLAEACQPITADQIDSELDGKLAQAYEHGRKDGIEEGKKLGQSEQIGNSVAAVSALLSQVRRDARNVIIDLSMEIAERILRKEIEQDPGWVLENAKATLDHQIPNGAIKLRLSPQDHERILALKPAPSWVGRSDGNLTLVADSNLQPGDCVLESERSRVDGRINNQLEQLREALREAALGALFTED